MFQHYALSSYALTCALLNAAQLVRVRTDAEEIMHKRAKKREKLLKKRARLWFICGFGYNFTNYDFRKKPWCFWTYVARGVKINDYLSRVSWRIGFRRIQQTSPNSVAVLTPLQHVCYGRFTYQHSEGGMIRLEALIELKFLKSSFSSCLSYWN